MKKTTSDQPDFGEFEFARASEETDPMVAVSDRFGDLSVCHSYVWDRAVARKAAFGGVYRSMVKPLLDGLFVLMTLPFSVPLIAICAIALWIEGGAPFYTQPRLGKNGKRFSILKLRTMVCNADAVLEDYLASDPEARREWDELQKLKDDPRVTPVGHFLRASSLDELPQIFNVLKGDMTLVGPRPMMPDQLTMYGDPRAYFALKPGITGFWQVSARNNTRFSYRNDLDAEYERKISLRTDVAVLYKTIGVVFRGTGC